MLESLKQMLGIGPSVDYRELVRQGATILDVRTKGEYSGGHIKGSINISLDQLTNNLHKLPKKRKTYHHVLCVRHEELFREKHLEITRILGCS